MARRRGRGGPVRRQKDQVWIPAVGMNQVVAGNNQTSIALIAGSDWIAGTGFERATLMGIRGWLSGVIPLQTNQNTGTILAAISLTHEDAGLPDIGTEAAYIEDILWTGGQVMRIEGASTGITGNTQVGWQEVINVRARRRITSEQIVSIDIRNNFAITLLSSFSFVLRCLVRRA